MAPERARIVSMVNKGDRVLELFAGVGAQAVQLAARADCRVDCVEQNAPAAQLCRENAVTNRVSGLVRVFEDDVRLFVPTGGTDSRVYDVVVCPRPEGGDLFFMEAIRWVKPGGRVHWYFVGSARDLDDALAQGLCELPRRMSELSRRRAPRRSVGKKGNYRWVIDFQVE